MPSPDKNGAAAPVAPVSGAPRIARGTPAPFKPPTAHMTSQVDSRPPGGSSPSGARKAPAPPPAPPSAAPLNDLAQLTAQLERIRKQTYFEVLNVGRDVEPGGVKAAYFKLAKSYHPDTVPPGAPEALVKVKADLFALIGEAHRTLGDPKLKQDYIAAIDSGTLGEKVDIAKLLLAEELFQKGRVLVKARKWADAVKVLDEAIAANPQEGEYYGWRGFARFFLFEDKAKGHALALKDLEYGIKLNPNAAATFYFHGNLWKLQGDLGKAKTYFKRCVELDPRHIDAQRELRLMK